VGWFVIKLAIVEIFFVFINIFIPRLNTSYRWQTIYRLIIPVSLLCVYGAYVGVKYV
jgi:LytS/YehU family sensor histidine kinase